MRRGQRREPRRDLGVGHQRVGGAAQVDQPVELEPQLQSVPFWVLLGSESFFRATLVNVVVVVFVDDDVVAAVAAAALKAAVDI